MPRIVLTQSPDLNSSNKENLPPFGALTILFFFILGFLITHEVSLQNSLQICAILALDLISGAIIWILISRKNEYSIFELFGVGVALGTSFNTIGQLVFRGTILGSLFNFFLLFFVVSLFMHFRNKKQFITQILPTRNSSVLSVCSTSIVLLCGDRYYLWPGALILSLAVFILTRLRRSPLSEKYRFSLLVFSLGSIALALSSSSILENLIFGHRSTTSYIGGWDGFYYEASSKSVMNFGPFDNIFLSDTKFAYYWFSDAWSGAFTRRANADAWVLTTQMGYVVCAMLIAVFIYLILDHFLKNLSYIFISCTLVATTTITGSASFLINQGSFSYSVSVIWLLLFFYSLVEYLKFQSRSHQALLIFSVLLLVMTKTTVAAPILGSMSLCLPFLAYSKKDKPKNLRIIMSIVCGSTLSILIYFIFIKATSENKGSYSDFKIDLVGFIFGIGTGVILLDISILVIFKFGFFKVLSERSKPNYLLQFLTLLALVSLAMSLIIRFYLSSANTFVATPFLLVTSMLIPLSLRNEIDKNQPEKNLSSWFIFGASVVGICSGLIATFRLQYLNFLFIMNPRPLILATIAPLIAILLIIAFVIYKYSNSYKNHLYLIALVVLASSMPGSYIAQSLRAPQQEFLYGKRLWTLPLDETQFVLDKFDKATEFIRQNLTLNDIIASNAATDKGLLAALTGIRNYASSYYPNLWGGLQDRYNLQSEFAKYPSESKYESLRDDCVTWFYLVKNSSNEPLTKYLPFAEIRFNDSYGAVLKLRDSRPLSSFCD